MKILRDLLDHLSSHDAPLRDVVIGVHWTAVLSKGCGLAATVTDPHPHRGPSVRDAGRLIEKGIIELLALVHSENLMEASIGMATINSLIDIEKDIWSEANAFEILAAQGRGKDVAVVGHFPFVPQLKEITGNLWVIEKHPHPGDLEEGKASDILPRCQVVGITSTAFINHTLESLLQLCRRAFVILIGPTTPLTPLLFDYGIDAISGSMVVNEEQVVRFVKQGATFQQLHHAGVRLLTMIK